MRVLMLGSAPMAAEAALWPRAPFDLVLANILANPLRALAPHMARHVAPNASIILSGLLPHHMNAVVAAYRAQGMVLQRRLVLDGWASLLLTAANVKSAARSN